MAEKTSQTVMMYVLKYNNRNKYRKSRLPKNWQNVTGIQFLVYQCKNIEK